MAPRLGKVLARCSLGPLNYAGSLVMAGRVVDALNELAPDNLHGGLIRGLDETAKLAGVRREDVESLLPRAEIRAAVAALTASQEIAVAAWNRHAGGIGGLLQGVADLTVDGRVPDVPLCLERLAKKVSRDKEFARPLEALAGDVERWQGIVTKCCEVLDEGGALARAYRRRRVRTVVIGVVLGLAIAAVAFVGLRFRAARAKVEAKLAVIAETPCAVFELDDSDLAHGSTEQRARADAARVACTAQREKAAREKEERDRREAAARADRERKEARDKACATFADHVAGGTLASGDAEAAGASPDLFGRVARGALEPGDLGPADPALPCAETPVAPRIAAAWEAAVLRSNWPASEELSKKARAAVVKHAGELSVAARAAFGKRADGLAHHAIVAGTPAEIARAAKVCAFSGELGVAPRAYCPGAMKLAGSP